MSTEWKRNCRDFRKGIDPRDKGFNLQSTSILIHCDTNKDNLTRSTDTRSPVNAASFTGGGATKIQTGRIVH
jgi:hypothetical protein